MTGVQLGRSSFSLPDNWEELNQGVLLKASPYLLYDTPHNRIELLKAVIPKKCLKDFYRLMPEGLYELSARLDWMYATWFDTPYIPSFKAADGSTYLLPEKTLKRCNVIEFAYADNALEKIVEGDSSKLDRLILALCRPKRKDKYKEEEWDGDPRERFNPVLIEQRVKQLKGLSLGFKLYFLLFFIGCKKSLAQLYSPIFRQPDDDDEEGEDTDTPRHREPDFGWAGVIWDLSGGIINEETVQYSNLHNVMAYLCKKHFENEAIKRQAKAHELSKHV